MRKARGTTCPHRILADRCRNDRDCPRNLLRLCGDPAIGDDEVDRQPDQIGRHCRQSSVIPGGEPILERDVRAVDVAELAQTLAEGIKRLRRWRCRRRQDADAEYLCGLMSARRHRASRRRAGSEECRCAKPEQISTSGAARPCSTPSLRVSEAARGARSLIPMLSLEHVVARGRWEPAAPMRAAESCVDGPGASYENVSETHRPTDDVLPTSPFPAISLPGS